MNGDKLVQLDSTAMSTSEFLASLADQARAQGLDTNAEIYDLRTVQAKQLEIDHAHLQREHDITAAALDDLRTRVKALDA